MVQRRHYSIGVFRPCCHTCASFRSLLLTWSKRAEVSLLLARERSLRLLLRLLDLGLEILRLVLHDERVNLDAFILQCPINHQIAFHLPPSLPCTRDLRQARAAASAWLRRRRRLAKLAHDVFDTVVLLLPVLCLYSNHSCCTDTTVLRRSTTMQRSTTRRATTRRTTTLPPPTTTTRQTLNVNADWRA